MAECDQKTRGTETEYEVQTGELSLKTSMALGFEHLPLPTNGFSIKRIHEEWRNENLGQVKN